MTEPQEQNEQKRVRVFGPDNKYYQFPAGTTKEAAVSFFKKRGITSPESKPIVPQAKPQQAGVEPPKPAPGPPQKPTTGQQMDIEAEREQAAIAKARPRWDAPEQVLKDPTWYGRSMKYLGGELIGGGKVGATVAVGGAKFIHDIASALDPIEGYKRPLGEPQAQVGKDVVDMGKGLLDIGKATWDFIRHFPEAEADPEKLGSYVTNVAMIVDGGVKFAKALEGKFPKVEPGSAVETAHKLTSGAPSRILRRKAFEDAYIHYKGLDVAKKITKATKAIDEEIETHASGIASQIDGKIPTGVVDAGAEAASILKEFQDVVKTPEKAHPLLVQMVKDATATSPKLWTWEKARQFRSSIGRVLNKVEGPQKVVLTKEYVSLTKKLSEAAKKYGLEKSWDHYNELERKRTQQFGDLIDSVHNAQSGQEVSGRLGKDVALTSEMTRNLSKYGLTYQEVLDFVKTSQRIIKNKNFYSRSLFRLVYGSPAGFTTAIGLRMAGAPYITAMGGGLLVGAASAYLINLARILRLSPEVIEQGMKEREIPGKMKFGEGTFPEGEESGSAPEEAPKPAPKPTPKSGGFKGGINVQGAEASTRPRTPESDVQSHTSEIERLKKIIDNPKATDEEKASARSQIKTHEELRDKLTKKPEAKKEAKDRWYRDKGSIPGEPVEFLDAPSDDVDKAKAAIIEHESPKGTKFEAMTSEGKSLGTFDTMEEAKKAAEAKFTKAEPGKHGTGKLAEQAKARERAAKLRKAKGPTAAGGGGLEVSGGGVAEKAQLAKEAAQARAQAQHLDVSTMQIPEMEEYVRTKNPHGYSGLQKLRKAGSIDDSEYKAALEYYTLEKLEE